MSVLRKGERESGRGRDATACIRRHQAFALPPVASVLCLERARERETLLRV